MKLSKLHIIFENCQGADVDVKHVSRIYIWGLREDIHIQNEDVFESTYCDYLKIILIDYAGLEYDSWGDPDKSNLMQRLFERDVTGITLTYDNGTEKTFHPSWGEKDFQSEYQIVEEKEKRDGKKYLEITFDKNVKV